MMASLPPWLVLSFHEAEPYPRQVPLREAYAGLILPAGTADRPFVYLNMVQTLDGAAVLDGKAWTIGTDVDHHLFRQLRVHADAVLYGSGSLRKDDVVVTTHPELRQRRVEQGQSANPLAIVASSTAAFPEDVFSKQFFTRTDFGKLVVTTPRAAPAAIERIQAAGVPVEMVPAAEGGQIDIAALMRHLARRGVRRLLAEGGPTFNVALARAGAVDELFLTLSLKVAGDPTAPRIFAAPMARPLQLISELRYEDEGIVREFYFRFRVM